MRHPLLITQTQDNSAPVALPQDVDLIDNGLSKPILIGQALPPEAQASLRETMFVGYHVQGLPFQIIISSAYEDEKTHQTYLKDCYKKVEHELNRFLFELLEQGDKRAVMAALDDRLSHIRSGTSVNLSISLVYEKNDKLYACGVSLGKVAYLLASPDHGIKQLAPARYHIEPHLKREDKPSYLEEFDLWADGEWVQDDFELAIDTTFHEELARGDEVVCYSQSIPSDCLSRTETTRLIGQGSFAQERKTALYSLKPSVLQQDIKTQPLLTQLASQPTAVDKPAFLVGKMQVPDKTTQETLKKAVLLRIKNVNDGVDLDSVEVATRAYLDWMNEHARGTRIIGCRFTHLYHGTSGRLRAERILEMIETQQPYHQIIVALDKAIQASSGQKHAYSRYLYDGLFKSDDDKNVVNNPTSFHLTQKSMRLSF